MNEKTTGVYFVDGCVARNALMGTASYLYELADADAEFTRFYMYNRAEDRWSQQEYEHEIVSVAFTPDRTWQLLSKRGILIQDTPNGIRELEIPDADTGPGGHGYVRQIRFIDGSLYVCGFRRQVYRLEGEHWIQLAGAILAPPDERRFGFLGMDGTAGDDIYAVGRKGEIYHYNGQTWRAIDSPTNCDLNRVRCVSPDLVYACGDSGVFLRGSGDRWEIFEDPEFRAHLWGLEVFDDVPYAAHLKGLMKFDGTALVPVDTGLTPPVGGYALHAADGILWSFGHDDLAFFDGKIWNRVTCPDNA